MPFRLKPICAELLGRAARRLPAMSGGRWVQLGACVVVAVVSARAFFRELPPPAASGQASSSPSASIPVDGRANSSPTVAGDALIAAPSAVQAPDPARPSGGAVGVGQAPGGSPPALPAAADQGVAVHGAKPMLVPGDAAADVVVSRNDTLERIFRRLGLSLTDLATLRSQPDVRAHLDRLRLGESLHLEHLGGRLDGLSRRLDEAQVLQVVRADGVLRAKVLDAPLEGRVRTIHGVVDRSLFEAVTAAGAHDQTAVNLADIFGWDIDFVLEIQRGDTFAVTYRELFQDGAYVKDGPILAASFVNRGHAYYAVRYVDPQRQAHYYTPDGRSMRKAFLRAPVEFTRVSSRFNSARLHPILNLIRAHKGVDYAAPMGTPVRAAGDGRVAFAGPKGGYGNVVEIDHSRGIVTVYGHLARFANGLRIGQHVAQGSIIAYVGMTGLATGPHLHYEYRVNGAFMNPQTVSLPGAEPIPADLRSDFLAQTAPLLASLRGSGNAPLVSR